MSRVLADTGPLYALVDPDDRYHNRARRQLDQVGMIVLQPIMLEAYTLILRKLGLNTAQSWMRELSQGVDLLNPMADDYQDARERITRYPDQEITLFDSTLATISLQLGIPVWTYDFHFNVMRVETWHGQ